MVYRYRLSGKFLVCIDQSMMRLVRYLLFGYRKCRLDSLGLSQSALFRVIKAFIKSRIKPGDAERIVTLPQFGHLGLQVHRGVKLFDFKRSEVTKVFSSDVSQDEANAEIAASRFASAISAAPRFLLADSNAKWFREEYVCGTHATDLATPGSSDFLHYYPEVEECLLELAGSRSAISVSATEYIEEVADSSFSERWSVAGIAADDIAHISTYINSLRSWLLDNVAADELKIVMAHGDFSLVNALVTDRGLRVIDWEGVSPRSIFGDVFNFALAEHYYERTSADFVSEAESLFDRYRAALISRFPDLDETASIDRAAALRIYYLERVRLMVDRDVTVNLNSVVMKSITMFNQFDADRHVQPL
jgi:hypothetical protein